MSSSESDRRAAAQRARDELSTSAYGAIGARLVALDRWVARGERERERSRRGDAEGRQR